MLHARLLLPLLVLPACMVGDPNGSAAGENVGLDFDAHAKVCAAGAKTMGIDVSYYQGTIDWTKVAAAGVKFAFIRLSDGTAAKDSKFATNWPKAKAAGITRGAYQFFRPGQSATAQADMMIAAIGTYQPGDLPPVIDVEATDGLGPSAVAARVKTWMDRVKAGLGVDPVVYSGMYFWRDQVGNPATYATNPLWIAQYTTAACPNIPSVWTTWTFWQHTASAHVNGIAGNVDQSWFNGSADDLLALANGGAAPTPDPPPTPTPTPTPSCHSATLGTDVPAGACVQRSSDSTWWQCDASGGWTAKAAPDASCSPTYPL